MGLIHPKNGHGIDRSANASTIFVIVIDQAKFVDDMTINVYFMMCILYFLTFFFYLDKV